MIGEKTYEVNGLKQRLVWRNWLESLCRNLRYGIRTLKRTPGFLFTSVGVMALCIGASTSLFTIVRSVLLKPLPFRDPDRLVMVYERYRTSGPNPTFDYNAVSPGDYYDWRAQTNGFEDMAAWQSWQFNFSDEQAQLPEVVNAAAATWNFFPLLGVRPAFGRTFDKEEDRPGGDVVMLTWSIFERRFSGNRSIVGRQIHLDGKSYTVVGVLPKGFAYPDAKVQVWVTYQSVTPPAYLHNHAFHQSRVIARLKPGVSLASAISQLAVIQYGLHRQYPHQAVCEGVMPRTLVDDLAQNVKKPLIILLCAVGCLLLIGCLNVANLLVARGAARQKEVAIRGALGAGRPTLIGEQLTEGFLICLGGGIIGTLLSLAATNWTASTWRDLPSAERIHIDGSVLLFACFSILITAILAGLLPAVSSTGKAVLAGLQASARIVGGSLSRTRLRSTLLTVEIAVTVVLLIAAGLLLKSFVRLRSVNLGCTTNNILTMYYSLPNEKYDTPQKALAFQETLLERLRAMPGVLAAGLTDTVPGAGDGIDDIFSVPEHPPVRTGEELPDALIRRADPDYFRTLQIPLVSGRFFTQRDRFDQANKAVISRQLARKYFPNEDALGKHIEIPLWNDTKYEIVGVVADTLPRAGEPSQETIYLPALSGSSHDATLVVRTAYHPLAFSLPIQKQFAALDPELPVSNVLTMQQIIGESVGNARLSAAVVLLFAGLSLILASIGLYGVLSYLMMQRTTELGIRVALGAQRQQVLGLALLDGLRPALFGLGLGIVVSIAATRIMQSMLYGTKSLDPTVFIAVAVTLVTVAGLACLAPAWHAAQVDPMRALRAE